MTLTAAGLTDALREVRQRPLTVVEPAEPDHEGRRIALTNNKGGVGKTYLTLALAEVVAETGQRVLVVDMDPQANATRRLGVYQPEATLADVLRPGVNEGAAAYALRRCAWLDPVGQGIDLMPSGLDLEDRILEAGVPAAVQRLATALYGVDDSYAVTLFDCPPSLGHLTQQVLACLNGPGDRVVVPLEPENDAIDGALRTIAFVNRYRRELMVPELEVGGIVVNRARAGTTLHTTRAAQLWQTFPGVRILEPFIPLRARIAEVQDTGAPLCSDLDLHAAILPSVRTLAQRLGLPVASVGGAEVAGA